MVRTREREILQKQVVILYRENFIPSTQDEIYCTYK